jgi:hypothetical protein
MIILIIILVDTQDRYKFRSLHELGWPEVLIYFSLTLLATLHRGTEPTVGGIVRRVRECAYPAEAVPIHSLGTGRLASDWI